MSRRTIYIILILCGMLLSYPALAQDSGNVRGNIEAKADKVLRQMSDYLNTLDSFSLRSESTIDALIAPGHKIQRGRSGDIFVRRPNRLRADIKGDIVNQQFFYDGKNITLYGKKVNYYAIMTAPDNIESAIDHAERSFGLVAPGADLISRNSYDVLIKDVQSAVYLGLSTVLGVECHHLAFRAEETDWQIWIENSATPLPRKFLITTKWLAGSPQFTALVTKWDVSAQLKDSQFTFVVPDKAMEILFLAPEDR